MSYKPFKCYKSPCAGKGFTTQLGLEAHWEWSPRHSDVPVSYDCELCDESFSFTEFLQLHTLVRHPSCDECQRNFVNQEALEQHTRDRHPVISYTCEDCDRSFVDEEALNQHFAAKHLTRYDCDDCGRDFVSPESLDFHRDLEHRPGGAFTCADCDREFDGQISLDQHLRDKHQKEFDINAQYTCDACKRDFGGQISLDQHTHDVHHAVRYICDKCNWGFINNDLLDQHKRDKHPLLWHTCPAGDRSFANQEALDQHLQEAWHPATGIFCFDCKRDFTSQDALGQHLWDKHGVLRHRCNDCKREFVNVEALDQHLVAQHPGGVSQFTCCDCERDFVNQVALDQHLRNKIHKPRVVLTSTTCTICNKELRTVAALGYHMNSSIHKDLPGANCPSCGTHFSLISGMTHHLESGTCVSGISKKVLDALLSGHDADGIITINPHPFSRGVTGTIGEIEGIIDNIDEWESGLDAPGETDEEEGGVPILTPSSSRSRAGSGTLTGLLTPSFSSIGEEPNFYCNEEGDFVCPQCPDRVFLTQRALEAHMASPTAHCPKLYKCPTNFFTGIFTGKKGNNHSTREFNTLSGLTQHLESEACKGGRKGFDLAVKMMGQKFLDMGFGGKWIGMGLS